MTEQQPREVTPFTFLNGQHTPGETDFSPRFRPLDLPDAEPEPAMLAAIEDSGLDIPGEIDPDQLALFLTEEVEKEVIAEATEMNKGKVPPA